MDRVPPPIKVVSFYNCHYNNTFIEVIIVGNLNGHDGIIAKHVKGFNSLYESYQINCTFRENTQSLFGHVGVEASSFLQ